MDGAFFIAGNEQLMEHLLKGEEEMGIQEQIGALREKLESELNGLDST